MKTYKPLYIAAVVGILSFGVLKPVLAQEDNKMQSRRDIGLKTLNEVTQSDGQGVVDSLKDFPVLADAIVDFAYGE